MRSFYELLLFIIVFKAQQILDYVLHVGSTVEFGYRAKKNIKKLIVEGYFISLMSAIQRDHVQFF